MKKVVKNIFLRLKHRKSRISFDSEISLNTVIGKTCEILASSLVNSSVAENCFFKGASIYSSSIGCMGRIETNSSLFSSVVKENVFVGRDVVLSNCEVGRYTYFAGGNRLFFSKIGSFCSIAENVCVGHAEHPYNNLSTSPLFYKRDNSFGINDYVINELSEFKETLIGNDVWIGLNAYIRSGVKIGDGAIIGAGSVVTKDVEPYTIVAGVPAKTIKKRFDNAIIEELQRLKWWDWPDEKLQQNKEMFSFSINDATIEKIIFNSGILENVTEK